MQRHPFIAALLVGPLLAAAAHAAEGDAEGSAPANGQPATNFFDGWGVGLAVIQPRTPSITDATIINDVVRVNAQSRQEASLLVSRHFYVMSDGEPCSRHLVEKGSAKGSGKDGQSGSEGSVPSAVASSLWLSFRRCVGLMVGVGLGSSGSSPQSSLINFAGLGLTFGSGVQKRNAIAWHFGFGVGRKFNARLLGDGFEADKAPPTGEDQVRFKTVDLEAKFMYFSTHW